MHYGYWKYSGKADGTLPDVMARFMLDGLTASFDTLGDTNSIHEKIVILHLMVTGLCWC